MNWWRIRVTSITASAVTRRPASLEGQFDVGFPGEEHHIAEQAPSMKIAMALLAVGAVVGGLLQIPKTTHVIDDFLEPTFADSALYTRHPSDGLLELRADPRGGRRAHIGIAIAYRIWVQKPGSAQRIRERLSALPQAVERNRWYFDEIYAAAIVRPTQASSSVRSSRGNSSASSSTGCSSAAHRAGLAGSTAVEGTPERLSATYAALLIGGTAGPYPLFPDRGEVT